MKMDTKVKLAVTFDRDDRTYVAGETVRGVVRARAEEAFSCRAFIVHTYWRTHGRGNTTTGGEHVLHTVQAPSWRAGEEYAHEFSFEVPANPVTYRGEYINVDYYVEAKLDLPWAVDQKERADFVVRPGAWDMRGRRVAAKDGQVGKGRSIAWIVVVVLGLVAWAVVGAWLALIIGVLGVALVYGKPLRRRVAESGLGPVAIRFASTRVTQGEAVPLSIEFKPVRRLTLNAVTARLRITEVCYSGSGSNRKRHKQELLDRVLRLGDGKEMRAGEAQAFHAVVEIPADKGFSFKARDNQIEWRLDCQVDVAGWPDRVQRYDLEVLPGRPTPGSELAAGDSPGMASRGAVPGAAPGARLRPARPTEEKADDAARKLDSPSRRFGFDVTPTPAESIASNPANPPAPVPTESTAPNLPKPTAPNPAKPTAPTPGPLAEVLAAIARTDRFSDARGKAIEYLADRPFDFTVEVGRVNATFSFDVPDPFRDGRTVEGETDGGTEVVLRFPSEHNELLDQINTRDRLTVSAVLTRWDDFRDRAEFEVSWWEGGS